MIATTPIVLENLIEIRKNNHIKQKDIANYLAYDRSYYSKIENGLYDLKFHDALNYVYYLIVNHIIYMVLKDIMNS